MSDRYGAEGEDSSGQSMRTRRRRVGLSELDRTAPGQTPQPREVFDVAGQNTSDTPLAATLGSSTEDPESVAEDDLCPICQLLLCHPVTTLCNHTLCESCMATWADVSVLTQIQIVDVDEEAVPFNAVSGLEARCPMCRTQTTASLNRARAQNLRNRYPGTYAERQTEEHESGVNREGGEIQTLTLSIGNRHHLIEPPGVSANKHEWTFFVRPSRTDIIEEVHIHLHPTFRPPKIIRTRPPYEVRRIGWGFFTIVAYVMLKPGYSWVSEDAEDSPDGAEKGMLGLEWVLDFARFGGKGSMGRLKLKVKNQRDWQDVSDEEEEDERVWSRLVRQYQSDGLYVPDEEM